MKLIESKTLGTAQASIEFTSIPQDGTDLVVLCSTRGNVDDGSTGQIIFIAFNTVGDTNLSGRFLIGVGSGSGISGALRPFAYQSSSNFTANTFSNSQFYISNYAGSTNKSISIDGVSENNGTTSYQGIMAGLWSNSAAINSIQLTTGSQFVAGSTVSLYKITKGSDGIVTTS